MHVHINSERVCPKNKDPKEMQHIFYNLWKKDRKQKIE